MTDLEAGETVWTGNAWTGNAWAGDAWEGGRLQPPASSAPVLAVAGFEGPLDWLLEMARAQRIDLRKISILALIEAFSRSLEAALSQPPDGPPGQPPDLARWGDWLVMAATLALLRSRLMLPPDAPEARTAQEEAEALRRALVGRAEMRLAAEWLDRRPQLGRDVFGWGGREVLPRERVGAGDQTELLRACLAALRVPEHADAFQPRLRPLWRMVDAVARITTLLAERPGGGALATFLPAVDTAGTERELRCRAALASTFLAGLELARAGALGLQQPEPWRSIAIWPRTDKPGHPG